MHHNNNKHIEHSKKQQHIDSEIEFVEQQHIWLKIGWTSHFERHNRKAEKERGQQIIAPKSNNVKAQY